MKSALKIDTHLYMLPDYMLMRTMKGYGSSREIKTSKHVSVVTDKGEEEYEQFSGSYSWKDLTGEITLSMKVDGKNITLLKLSEQLYDKLSISVSSLEEIDEIVQKQLERVSETA